MSDGSKAQARLKALFDDGTYTALDKLANEAETGYGRIGGMQAFAFSQDAAVGAGGMGRVQAAKLERVYALAAKTGAPVVGLYDSRGALLKEGLDALNAYGTLVAAAGNLSGVVPQIAVILGPCVGAAAVLAAQADLVIMREGASFYVTNGTLLEDKTGQIGSASLAAENGTAHLVAKDEAQAIELAAQALSYLPANNLDVPPVADYRPSDMTATLSAQSDALDVVQAAVDAGSYFPISQGYGACVLTGFARVGGSPVGLVATDPKAGGGKICADGADKAARFVRLCDAFSLPVITLLNCDGFLGTAQAEFAGDLKRVARLTHAYAEATAPKVTVIWGDAIGAAYIAFAGKAAKPDAVLAWPNAVISALKPQTAVETLLRDKLAETSREELEAAYTAGEASPARAAAQGFIDDVIEPAQTAQRLVAALEMLAGKRESTLQKKHSNMPF